MNEEKNNGPDVSSGTKPLNETIDDSAQRDTDELVDSELDSVAGGTPVRNLRG